LRHIMQKDVDDLMQINSHSVPDFVEESDYYKFTIVRNPYERAVSLWLYLTQKVDGLRGMDFAQFLYYGIKYNNITLDHSWPQYPMVIESGDIIRMETLSESWQNVAKKIGVRAKVEKHNATQHGDYRQYYDSMTKRRVEELYCDDIKYLGYEF